MSEQTEFLTTAPAKLRIQHVSKWFRTARACVHALDDISLEIAAGEFVCIVGPSGCGKSTLLDIVSGLVKPDQGRVIADEREIEGPGPHCMVMFQEPALFPWLTVLGNVMFGLKRMRGASRAKRREIAELHLKLVGLDRFSALYVHELSGGMRQRAALARSLAPDPSVLLMDEPMAALDAMTREQLYSDLQRISAVRKKTIVLVTHNVREAICLGDRVLLLSPSPGRIGAEFKISLSRPRDINMPEVAAYAQRITAALKAHMPKEG